MILKLVEKVADKVASLAVDFVVVVSMKLWDDDVIMCQHLHEFSFQIYGIL